MKLPTVETHVKLDINVAISISVTLLVAFSLFQNNATQQEVQEIKPAVEKIPKEVKNLSRADIVNILEQITVQGNNTKLTQDQILQYSKQILREVK